MTLDGVLARFRAWVTTEPALPGPLDPATAAFCRRKLREVAAPGVLEMKLDREIGGRRWEPLGRLLVVIAEHDVLGTAAAVVGAALTNNRVRIKARTTRPLVTALAHALDLADCEILDWSSTDGDDHLDGVDGVLLAGGEALIRHYRRVTPPGIRLIELGPKLSCAAIGHGFGDVDRLADALVTDVTLFDQNVCSSPYLVFVDDAGTAEQLRERIRRRVLPVLPDGDRLLQLLRARELELLARLGDEIAVDLDPASGWGVTIARDPAHRLPKGFAFVVGPIGDSLAALAAKHPHDLQTLGTAGEVPEQPRFTHRCPIGRMHERSPLEPHDGFLELAALVKLTSREES